MVLLNCWRVATRRRLYDDAADSEHSSFSIFRGSNKRHQLSSMVVALGGALGIGVWVVSIEVSRISPGPSALISILLAIIASILTALCYMEFMNRLRSCGSAFTFTYFSMGELSAFVVGWTLVTDYTIGAAVAARTFSHHLDSISDGFFSRVFKEIAPINHQQFSEYFDFISFGTVFVLGGFMLITTKSTSVMNGLFTCIGLVCVLVVITTGGLNANVTYWDTSIGNTTLDCFRIFPYCGAGTLRAAAPALYALALAVGAVGGAPRSQDPRASVRGGSIALAIMSCIFSVVTIVVSMARPSYELDPALPLSKTLDLTRWSFFAVVIDIGGIISLLASIFPAIYMSSHILTDMGRDKLIPCINAGGSCSRETKITTQAKVFSIAITACLTGIFNTHNLLNMLSVGIILAYIACAIGIIVLRYDRTELTNSNYIESAKSNHFCGGFLYLMRIRSYSSSTYFTAQFVNITAIIYCLFCILLAASIIHLSIHDILTWISIGVSCIVCAACVVIIASQPMKSPVSSGFLVPLVPLLPCFNILLLIFIAVTLDPFAWIRFGVWLAIGFQVYFVCLCCYDRGARNLRIIEEKPFTNGHIQGNLNRAFSISSEHQNSLSTGDPKSESPELEKADSNDNIIKPRRNILKDEDLIVSEGDLMESLEYYVMTSDDTPVAKKALEKVCDNDENSIIEMFDQMLATVEAPLENGEAKEDNEENANEDNEDTMQVQSETNSFQFTELNVVAIVHQEEQNNTEATERIEEATKTIENKDENNEDTEKIDAASEVAENNEEATEDGQILETTQIERPDSPESNCIIPTPPPMDKNFFMLRLSNSPKFLNSDEEEISIPEITKKKEGEMNRERTISTQSDVSDNGNVNQKFMDKLNTLLRNQISVEVKPPKPRRSLSSSHLTQMSRESPPASFDEPNETADETKRKQSVTLSREQIKNKLESLFATNNNIFHNPKLAKPNDHADPADRDESKPSTPVLKKITNATKLDTLQLQRAKFGDVLNALKLTRANSGSDDEDIDAPISDQRKSSFQKTI